MSAPYDFNLRNILSLLLVLLTGASLNAVADSYNVAPMTAGKVTVSPNDEFVNAPINLINYGTNPPNIWKSCTSTAA